MKSNPETHQMNPPNGIKANMSNRRNCGRCWVIQRKYRHIARPNEFPQWREVIEDGQAYIITAALMRWGMPSVILRAPPGRIRVWKLIGMRQKYSAFIPKALWYLIGEKYAPCARTIGSISNFHLFGGVYAVTYDLVLYWGWPRRLLVWVIAIRSSFDGGARWANGRAKSA